MQDGVSLAGRFLPAEEIAVQRQSRAPTVAGPGETAHVGLEIHRTEISPFSVGDQRVEKGDDVDADAWVDVAMAAVIWVPPGQGPR